MYQLMDRPAKRMKRSLPAGTSTSRMDLSGWWNPGQLTYSSHPPLLGQVLRDDARIACAIHPQNLTSRISRLTIPPKKLSCIN
jgi:hypothetical protein